jgi:hypothetical protein
MVRMRPHLTRAGAVTALLGLTTAGLATPAAADPANAPADVKTLMSHLSGGFTPADCHPAGARSATVVAAVDCPDFTNHDPGGPWNATYLLYANTDDLNADFQRFHTDPKNPVQPFPDGTKGPTQWNRGGHSGSVVFAGAGGNSVVYLVWTDIPARMLVAAEQSIEAGRTEAALWNWWQAEGVR